MRNFLACTTCLLILISQIADAAPRRRKKAVKRMAPLEQVGFQMPSTITDTVKAVPAKGLYMNALDLLQGQSAGVNVSSDGINGNAVLNSVRVRGSSSILGANDPMVIIDGVI